MRFGRGNYKDYLLNEEKKRKNVLLTLITRKY